MKKFLGVAVIVGSILVTGCGHDMESTSNEPAPLPQNNNNAPAPMAPVPADGGPGAASNPQAPGGPSDMSSPGSSSTTTTSSSSSSSSTSAPKPPTNYPMGIVVPGKKGFVKSPYAPYADPISVLGEAPGTAVRDPQDNNPNHIFIVPPY